LAGERYRLSVLPFKDASQDPDGLIALLRSAALDGVVLTPPSSDLEVVLDALDRAGIPYGRVAANTFLGRGACARMDDVAAARTVAEHVLDLGHRSIGVIYGHRDHSASAARTQGYREAFEARGLDYAPVVSEQGDFTLESGVASMQRILNGGIMPTALLVQNDDMALGVLMVAREAGLDVPGDLSIAGFDDAALASLSWPTLTTVRQPVVDMAHCATAGLLRMLAGETEIEPLLHGHQLKVRRSTAPPRR
jgi:LacI family transcriptional regulator